MSCLARIVVVLVFTVLGMVGVALHAGATSGQSTFAHFPDPPDASVPPSLGQTDSLLSQFTHLLVGYQLYSGSEGAKPMTFGQWIIINGVDDPFVYVWMVRQYALAFGR